MVEREPYFRLCLSEVCGCTPHRPCHCTILTAYTRQCAQEGVPIPWRNQTFCRKCGDQWLKWLVFCVIWHVVLSLRVWSKGGLKLITVSVFVRLAVVLWSYKTWIRNVCVSVHPHMDISNWNSFLRNSDRMLCHYGLTLVYRAILNFSEPFLLSCLRSGPVLRRSGVPGMWSCLWQLLFTGLELRWWWWWDGSSDVCPRLPVPTWTSAGPPGPVCSHHYVSLCARRQDVPAWGCYSKQLQYLVCRNWVFVEKGFAVSTIQFTWFNQTTT